MLGKVYGVISKRRGRIIAEDLKDGTSFWQISSRMPVVESFGFSDGEGGVQGIDITFFLGSR